jgi:Zn-dependent protease
LGAGTPPAVPRSPFDPHPLSTLLRALNASFRIGTLRGVEVRMYWLALIVTPLIWHQGGTGLSAAEAWTFAFLGTFFLFAAVLIHEFGHIAAGRRYGILTPLVTISPLGGLAHMSAPAPTPSAEIRVALAGPVTHLPALLVALPLLLWVVPAPGTGWRPEGWWIDPVYEAVRILLWLNLSLLLFNLLPLFPMDGGRALRGLLARRMHPNRATLVVTRIGTWGAIAFLVIGVVGWVGGSPYGVILALIGLSNLLACRQEALAARYTEGPYGRAGVMAPWEGDPDAWKRGGGSAGRPPSRPGFFARRRLAKQARAQERARDEADALQVEVDRILDKVRDVGMAGLSAREKDTLERASRRLRR